MQLLQKARVVSVRNETPRVREVVLEHALRDRFQPFKAGSYITVALPGGINRQYSLCGDPRDTRRYRLGVLLTEDSRGGSRAIHALKPGDTLFVSYPGNSFGLSDAADHHVLLAGGIGITPILSMASVLAANGSSFEVHYGARSSADLGFLAELSALCPQRQLHCYTEGSGTAPRPDFIDILGSAPPKTHIYACGPAPMLEALMCAADTIGFPVERIHKEQFAALSVGQIHGEPFEIEIAGSGEVIPVGAEQTALGVLRATGHVVPSSCEGGICGECRVGLVAGTAIHQDKVLSDDEARSEFICCVSRAKGRVTLQLPPQPKPDVQKESPK
jgi:vanillate O-demethylase ferredoxin subunit